jgi:hypothetical protein
VDYSYRPGEADESPLVAGRVGLDVRPAGAFPRVAAGSGADAPGCWKPGSRGGWLGRCTDEPDATPTALSARQKAQAAITLAGSLRPCTISGDQPVAGFTSVGVMTFAVDG